MKTKNKSLPLLKIQVFQGVMLWCKVSSF